ncbi:MAG: prolipoprotein diacylglyceryl transferase [Candidatus Berkelbacteria bacterium]|nr:prolipoprotein diacylglyceryl transferase [Candidatus Berkelbacteria bacterium]
MRIILFSIFGLNIYSHGVFLTLAMIIGGWIYFRLLKKSHQETKYFIFDYILSLLVGIIVARIFYYLLNLTHYQTLTQVTEIWQGGIISLPGFIAGGLTFFAMLKIRKFSISVWLDLAGIAFPLAVAIGRIGCVLSGEFGVRTTSIFALYGHMPTTVFEIFLGLTIFAINFYLYLKKSDKLPTYTLFAIFVGLYSFGRILIDAYSIDSNRLGAINLSQMTSTIVFVVVIFSYSFHLIHKKLRKV